MGDFPESRSRHMKRESSKLSLAQSNSLVRELSVDSRVADPLRCEPASDRRCGRYVVPRLRAELGESCAQRLPRHPVLAIEFAALAHERPQGVVFGPVLARGGLDCLARAESLPPRGYLRRRR